MRARLRSAKLGDLIGLVALFNQYVRQTLKYGEGQTYLPQADFSGGSTGTPNTTAIPSL